ncbi:MAG: 3,4-dihydroxy-2-butanone-4-phosphate synthase [Cypionkella sp.]
MSRLSIALAHLKQGGMILLLDDEDRENEGDLVVAGEFASPDAIKFMAVHGRGLICLALTDAQVDRLGLPPMVASNKARRSTAFTVSIEARDGITTGISAFDRATTIATAINPAVAAAEIVSPGHVFPLRANPGGVLARNGHTEGAIDLMKLAGLQTSAVICEVMGEDGHMAKRPELEVFAKAHSLPILTIEELVNYRLRTEILVEEAASAELPSSLTDAPMKVHAFSSLVDGAEHLAIVKPCPVGVTPLVRIHSECLTGDALGSLRCDCGQQLQESIKLISQSDGGALIYLRGQEGRGIGLANKIRAYALQDQGMDTVEANAALGFPADLRNYAVAAQILRSLGMVKVDLLSNNPQKLSGLADYGIEIAHQRPLIVAPNVFNARYLATKSEKFGHMLSHQN